MIWISTLPPLLLVAFVLLAKHILCFFFVSAGAGGGDDLDLDRVVVRELREGLSEPRFSWFWTFLESRIDIYIYLPVSAALMLEGRPESGQGPLL